MKRNGWRYEKDFYWKEYNAEFTKKISLFIGSEKASTSTT